MCVCVCVCIFIPLFIPNSFYLSIYLSISFLAQSAEDVEYAISITAERTPVHCRENPRPLMNILIIMLNHLMVRRKFKSFLVNAE